MYMCWELVFVKYVAFMEKKLENLELDTPET